MIVTHTADQPTIRLPNSALSGVSLIPEGECKGYSMYEARIGAGQSVPLRSPDCQACVHFYYVVVGTGQCRRDGSAECYDIDPDHLVALSSDLSLTLTVSAAAAGETAAGMRLVVVYYPDADARYKSIEMARNLRDVIGTERDVGFGNGKSRRFTLAKDGWPLTITNTLVFASTSSNQVYKNHVEAAYYIHGENTYAFDHAGGNWTGETTRVDERDGTNFFMNLHDKHTMTPTVDSQTICVFDPPLTGEERHTFTEDGFSSY